MQGTRVNSPRKGQGPLSCVGWGCVNGLTQFAGCKTAKSIPFHNKKTFETPYIYAKHILLHSYQGVLMIKLEFLCMTLEFP